MSDLRRIWWEQSPFDDAHVEDNGTEWWSAPGNHGRTGYPDG